MICAYVGSGLQLFVAGALFAWLPSYLGRAYDLAPDKAGIAAAGFILLMGVGMIVCGVITDRLTTNLPIRKWTTALVYASLSLVLLPGLRPRTGHGRSWSSSAVGASSPPARPAPRAPWSRT